MSTWRVAFETKRAHEYFHEAGLRALIGYEKALWPLALLKEALDNALDACEFAEVAPQIAVTIEPDCFTIQDNGPGLRREIIDASLDYDIRISDKKWYISCTRGQLGSALKTMWPAVYVSTGKAGLIEVIASGWHHKVEASFNEILHEPLIKHEVEKAATVKNGSLIRVHWQKVACLLTTETRAEFYRGTTEAVVGDLVRDFCMSNPHATFSVTARGQTTTFKATNPAWEKWRACDRPSAHWYSPESLRDLIVAHLGEQERLARRGITRPLPVRDFCNQFDGLKGTQVRKRVLEQAHLSGFLLQDLVIDGKIDMNSVRLLLDAMRDNSRPVKPKRLGVIGREHMRRVLKAYGADKDFEWKPATTTDDAGLPFVIEVAFGVKRDGARKLLFGINNSVVFKIPTQDVWYVLQECKVRQSDPVVLLIHATSPKFDFTSQGKGTVTMSESMENELARLLRWVTRKWKQAMNRKEARDNDDALTAAQIEKLREKDRVQSEKDQIKAAAYEAMPEAYRRASGDLGTCTARQVMYSARALVLAATGGKCWKNSSYFTQRLLVDYQDEHEEECADWDITYDARGHLREPHAGEKFGIGTVETRSYINGWRDGSEGIELDRLQIGARFPTSGPLNRYRCAVFVEKEGFDSLVDRSGIAERYDVAFFSSKGQSTIATRQLVDSLSEAGVKILVLHDFDKAGLRICHWLSHDSPRYKYKVPPDVVDVGLRLPDVQRLKLESEEVRYQQKKHPGLVLCDCEDVTAEEIKFLVDRQEFNRQTQKKMWVGRRVELNALTADEFVAFLKRKLEENGVQKVVPDRDTLKVAWRRAQMVERLNDTIDSAMDEIGEDGWTRPAPRDLARQVRDMLRRKPLMPWDEALSQLVRKAMR